MAAAVVLMAVIALGIYASTLPLRGATVGPVTQKPGSTAIYGTDGPGALERAPDFMSPDGGVALLTGLDDRPIRLADFTGRPLWIVFWATWCTPCQQEAVNIRAAYHAHEPDDLAVLAIDVQEPAAAVRDYVAVHDLDYTIGLDPTAAVMALYAVRGLPSHVFVDRDGVIRTRYAGQMTAELMDIHLETITSP